MAENKVQFNLKNAYYAVLTETVTQGVTTETFATPKAIKGAVSVALSPDGEQTPFYADGIKYYISKANNGYSGSIEFAKITDEMMADIWGMTKNSNNVIFENTDDTVKEFALLFQIDGDSDQELYAFYKCSATRPAVESQTNGESKEPKTQSLELTISPLLSNGNIKARTTNTTPSAVKNAWFSQVVTGVLPSLNSFSLDGHVGTIDGTNVSVTVPSGTAVTAMVATFTTSAETSVKVGNTTQVSGTTANDFTSPVTYKLTLGETIKNYTVTVTVAQ